MRKITRIIALTCASALLFAGCQKTETSSQTSSSPSLSGNSSSSVVPADVVTKLKVASLSNPSVLASTLIGSDNTDYKQLAKTPLAITESQGIFERKLAQIATLKPDVLLLSGNLTFDGSLASHTVVSNDLKAFKNTMAKTKLGFRIVLTPGANDIGNTTAKDYSSAVTTSTPGVDRDTFLSIYKDACYSDAVSTYVPDDGRFDGSLSYVTNINGYAFLAMDDANYSSQTDSSGNVLATSQGVIGAKEVNWIKNRILESRKRGESVIGLLNHSVVAHYSDEPSLPSSMLTDYSAFAFDVASAGMTVAFTASSEINDVASYTGSGNQLIDIASGNNILYPSTIRCIDFTHTYRYSSQTETLRLVSAITDTTNVSYLDTDKGTKTISDLSTYLEGDTIPYDTVLTFAKSYPYEILHTMYPKYNEKDFLKNLLSDNGITAEKINSAIVSKVGTVEEPLYLSGTTSFRKTAKSATDYSHDSDGNAIVFDYMVDHGIHKLAAADYRFVISKDAFQKLLNNKTLATLVTSDMVFYLTDDVMKQQINDIIDQIDTNLIKSDVAWGKAMDILIPLILEYKVDDTHTVLNMLQDIAFGFARGSETQTGYIKTARDDIRSGKDSKILNGMIASLAEQGPKFLDALFGYLDISTLIKGVTCDTPTVWIAVQAVILSTMVPLSKALENPLLATPLQTAIKNLFTDDVKNQIGIFIAGKIDSYTTDTNVPDDLTTDVTISYSVSYQPKN